MSDCKRAFSLSKKRHIWHHCLKNHFAPVSPTIAIYRYIVNKWQLLWNNSIGNKLFEIKPVIGQSQPVVRNVRQEDVVLACLRIGHTRITHSYLLKREEPPYCFGCDELFTVRHFLLECSDFSHIRNQYSYFHVDTIKQLFNDVPIDNVFLFLKRLIFLINCSCLPLNCLFLTCFQHIIYFFSRRRTCIVI